MQKIYQTAIIGGGAAGLMTAVEVCRGDFSLCGKDVIILEKNDRVGKKLIATGNGQGNLTNENLSREYYYGDKKFIDEFLLSEKNICLKRYLEELGIPLYSKADGKVYPLSRQASSVLDIIRQHLSNFGVEEKTSAEVLDLRKEKDFYRIKTSAGEFFAKTVVLATGGSVAKQFGTDGSAYSLAIKFKHKKSQIYPSLVQLKTNLDTIRGLKGLKEVAKVMAIHNGKLLKSATGDLLFTEFGVSGASVFQVSSAVTDKSGAILKIEFLPELTLEELTALLENRRKNYPYLYSSDMLCGIVNKRIGQAVIKTAKDNSPTAVAFALKNFTLSVLGSLGANYAQVTKGGILTEDVNALTMESKLSENLFLTGELLNVDGDCGGYNLTFAFVTGILAGKAIKEKLTKNN